jgi:hypothetical protein
MDQFSSLLSDRLSVDLDAHELRTVYDPGILTRRTPVLRIASPAVLAECLSFHRELSEAAQIKVDEDVEQ